MKRDAADERGLDERCAALFAAGRREVAPEATRERIARALRARSNPGVATSARRWQRALAGVALVAAAGLLLVVRLSGRTHLDTEPVSISAERPHGPAASIRAPQNRSLAPVQPPSAASVGSLPALHSAAPRPPKREPASLEQELASVQRARSALKEGSALAALAELDSFGRGPGWRQLAVEASMLRIESLARAGRTDEARNLARRFVAQHPNHPLVDRARTFTAAPSPSGARSSPQENTP